MKKWLMTLVCFLLFSVSIAGYVRAQATMARTSFYFHYALGGSWFSGDEYPGEGKDGLNSRSFGMTFSFPLDKNVLRLETGFMYETRGTRLTGSSLENHRVELEYFTFLLNIAFEYKSGFQLSTGMFFSARVFSRESADGDPGRALDDVIEPGDIGFNLKMAYRINLSRTTFIAPYVRGQIGFVNIYYSDFSQNNVTLRAGLELGFRP